jgi:hypothetical protein
MGVFLNSSTDFQCTYNENVSQIPKAYLAAQAADTTKSSQIIHIQHGSSLEKPEAYILYYLSSISLYYIKFM